MSPNMLAMAALLTSTTVALASHQGAGQLNIEEFPMVDVQLTMGSAFMQATELNLEYLLMLEPDRLLYSFRVTANLSTQGAQPYGGWEAPDVELRGHFVGHYLSATAMMRASTQNATIKKNMDYVVSELKKCQDAMKTGYLSAFPTSWFDRLENLKGVWAPYYTIHKIMAGLFDQHRLASNPDSLNMAVAIAKYFYARATRVIAQNTSALWEQIINDEFGGMNEVLYNLYKETGEADLADFAHLFDKPVLMGPLAVNADLLTGLHANTHIPEVIGAARRFEVLQDPTYSDIVTYFLHLINATRSYATGGSNSGEHWGKPHRLGDTLGPATEETCTTYNILKVARHLFKWTGSAALADFYERALLNGIMGVQRPGNPGVSLYMLPLGAGNSKPAAAHGWGTPFDSFWCCYGTAVESFSKLTDSIFFKTNNTLYVNQYVNSMLHWDPSQAIYAELKSNFPVPEWSGRSKVMPPPEATLQLVSPTGLMIHFNATIMLRIPMWTSQVSIKVNNQPFAGQAMPGSYANLTQLWIVGTMISISFTPKLHTEGILDDRPMYRSLTAIFYGPLLLVGMTTGDRSLTLEGDHGDVSKWISPAPYSDNLHSFQLSGSSPSRMYFHHSGFELWYTTMPADPTQGTFQPDSTFRVISTNAATGDSMAVVVVESFNYPGYFVSSAGLNQQLALLQDDGSSAFQEKCRFSVVSSSASNSTVMLKQGDDYVSTYKTKNSAVTLQEIPADAGEHSAFITSSTFIMADANTLYKSYSFIATGKNRKYLLVPLNAVVDEEYTAYFNVTTAA
ncbi:uncharacterized protein LOC135828155 [Sycon ciliatum]|uniref:uncharacterized protein LOC135828155 n=1 Tax=Sycon ciliatum TaxID=27933 RepID=UPI0031F63864